MSKMISSRTIQVDKVQTSREEVCQRLSKILFGYRLVMVTVITVVIMPILCGSCGSSLRTSGNSEDAKTLYNKGLESYRSDDMPAAIEAWSQALSIYKTIKGTERDQAGCYKNIGIVLGDIFLKAGDFASSLRLSRARSGSRRLVTRTSAWRLSTCPNMKMRLPCRSRLWQFTKKSKIQSGIKQAAM